MKVLAALAMAPLATGVALFALYQIGDIYEPMAGSWRKIGAGALLAVVAVIVFAIAIGSIVGFAWGSHALGWW